MTPTTKPEMLDALTRVEGETARFFDGLSNDELVLRLGEAWTPAQHLDHLNTVISTVGRGFAMPRLILRLRFGATDRKSRSFPEIRDAYRAVLAGGAGASGPYVPAREELAGAAVTEKRAALLARWQRVHVRLRDAIEPWSEGNLDHLRLPHPLLGKLTARELLLWAMYHNQHHVAAAMRRLPRFSAAQTTQ